MPNHFHLFVYTRKANLGRFMHQFQTAYTVFFKLKHDKVGHLFQGRYKAIVVDRSNYGLEVTRYIHLNPVRKKSLTGTSIEDKIKLLQSYNFSSYPAYIGIQPPLSYLHTQNTLEQFSNKIRNQHNEYRKYVETGLITGKDEELMDNVLFQSFLGANAFIDSIKAKILENDPECNGRAAKIVTSLPVETVLEFISHKFDIPVNAIVKRRSKNREIRQASIWLCSNICIGIQSLTDIGRYFGDIKVTGVTRIRDRFAKKLTDDPALHKKYTKLLQQLRQLHRSDPS